MKKLDPQVERAVAAAAATFAAMGAIVEEVDPPLEDPAPIAWDIWNAGAALALSAFTPDQRRQMDPGLVACAETGARFPASALIDALLYRRTKAVIAMAGFFERYDLMITPTMPTGAIPLGADLPPTGFAGQQSWGPLWTDWCPYTPPFNVTQQPAGTVPCGLDGDGLPIGLQIVGWKRRRPPCSGPCGPLNPNVRRRASRCRTVPPKHQTNARILRDSCLRNGIDTLSPTIV